MINGVHLQVFIPGIISVQEITESCSLSIMCFYEAAHHSALLSSQKLNESIDKKKSMKSRVMDQFLGGKIIFLVFLFRHVFLNACNTGIFQIFVFENNS